MDYDMKIYSVIPFNLEILKLSSYYKQHREIVVFAQNFMPERHQKFIVRKDYDDGLYPPGLNKYKNVEYGGYAFSNNIYRSLPIEIELSKPDTSIYERMESIFLRSKLPDRNKIFKNLMTAEHGRISLDGKTVWPDYLKQFGYLGGARNLILHDYDLNAIDGGYEAVKYMLSVARRDGWATRLGMKFPVQVSNGTDLLKWSTINPNSTFYSIRYNGMIDNDTIFRYATACNEKSIYYNLDYDITADNPTEEEVCQNRLRTVLRQGIFLRSQRAHFVLKYMDNFFSDPMWERVIRLLQIYFTSLGTSKSSHYYDSLTGDTVYDFANHSQNSPKRRYGEDVISRPEIREIFYFVKEKNYPLFDDFYSCNLKRILEENHDWI